MHKMTIKLNIVIIVIIVLAFVCSMETYALHFQEESFIHQDTTKESPEGDTASKCNDKTADAAQVTEANENTSGLPSVVSGERHVAESAITAHTEVTATIATYVPNEYDRIVTIGNLPAGHDPSLVLRKGRTIGVVLPYDFNSEISLDDSIKFIVDKNTYDDSGKNLLMPERVFIHCMYKIFEEQNIFKIDITAVGMDLDQDLNVYVLFSDPPRSTLSRDRLFSRSSSKPTDFRKGKEEASRMREQLFLSPIMKAELLFNVESEDRTSERGRIMFSENTSGDRSIIIGRGYRFDLRVEKDILFSGPFSGRKGYVIY